MPALAFLVTYLGYWAFAYGLSQVRGCNASFIEIGWPGKFQGCKPDVAAGTTTASASVKQLQTTTNAAPSGQVAAIIAYLKAHPNLKPQS